MKFIPRLGSCQTRACALFPKGVSEGEKKIYIFRGQELVRTPSVKLKEPHSPLTHALTFFATASVCVLLPSSWLLAPGFWFPFPVMLPKLLLKLTLQHLVVLAVWHFFLAYFVAQLDACNCNLFTLVYGTWQMLNSCCLHSLSYDFLHLRSTYKVIRFPAPPAHFNWYYLVFGFSVFCVYVCV